MATPLQSLARLGTNVADTSAGSGLWAAMADRFRDEPTIPTVEVSGISPRGSMFDYDARAAVPILEMPDRIG